MSDRASFQFLLCWQNTPNKLNNCNVLMRVCETETERQTGYIGPILFLRKGMKTSPFYGVEIKHYL